MNVLRALAVTATLFTALAGGPSTPAVADQADKGQGIILASKIGDKTIDAGPITRIQNCDGRYEDFRISDGNSSEHRWQLSPGGSWSNWNSLGGGFLYGNLDVGRNGDCKVEVFAVGRNNEMYTTWQSAPNSGPWYYWTSIGGKLYSEPTTVIINGTLGVCARGGDANLWCNRHTQPYASPWTGWFRI
ncbi:hypothetical protein [Allorhizocola rhizosphaerae]|uniref:hypothetical protein n=1 Tax=Allorhizocola rhizosphaerae TaxID=1872709 RepID=UPI000E3C8806|nr:hypothetical protein [Allorhizocola rhizosphaerae]